MGSLSVFVTRQGGRARHSVGTVLAKRGVPPNTGPAGCQSGFKLCLKCRDLARRSAFDRRAAAPSGLRRLPFSSTAGSRVSSDREPLGAVGVFGHRTPSSVVSMKSCPRARPRDAAARRRGATVVEFAVVAPLFLLFIFALVEFGRYVMVQQALTNAAREGSRTAALATTMSTTRVRDAVNGGLRGVMSNSSEVSPVTVTVTPENLSTVSPGTHIRVSVEADASEVSWLPGDLSRIFGRLGATSTHARE